MIANQLIKSKNFNNKILLLFFVVNIYSFQTSAVSLTLSEKETNKTNLILESDTTIEACDETNCNNSFIYCNGKLIKAVNLLNIYKDSKTFVDKPMKFDPLIVKEKFEKTFPENIPNINKSKLLEFIDKNFEEEGTELESCILDEWHEEPSHLKRIKDLTLRKWAFDLNLIWKKLCRKIKKEVFNNQDRYSILYVPQPFIVPGGRFRESYYWDAYWIIKGLVASGLLDTTKNMITNFAYIIENHGFIPNGARVYYLQRSHPPFLIPMVYEYFEASRNKTFVKEILNILEKEISYWDNQKTIQVKLNETHTVYQYRAGNNVPRPESYREDYLLTRQLTKEEDKKRIYKNLASAAESGWDFSTRWLEKPNKLETIQTTDILPVDLNAFMCWNFKLLKYLFTVTGDEKKAAHYDERYRKFLKTFKKVFYLKEENGWYDYNIKTKKYNLDFFGSVATPLFTGCYDELDLQQSAAIFDKMEKIGVFNFAGGVPTSINNASTQQWDYPNGWSPLNHMLIEGLRQSKNSKMQQKAFWLAQKWVLNNYRVYTSTNSMWEKYNVIQTIPDKGDGGEYDVQEGFGWSNGVVLDLLRTYSDRMEFDGLAENAAKNAQNVFTHLIKQKNLIQEQSINNLTSENIPQKINKYIQSNNKKIFQTNSALQRINNTNVISFLLCFIVVKKIFNIY